MTIVWIFGGGIALLVGSIMLANFLGSVEVLAARKIPNPQCTVLCATVKSPLRSPVVVRIFLPGGKRWRNLDTGDDVSESQSDAIVRKYEATKVQDAFNAPQEEPDFRAIPALPPPPAERLYGELIASIRGDYEAAFGMARDGAWREHCRQRRADMDKMIVDIRLLNGEWQ